jgi:hypothetical protein
MSAPQSSTGGTEKFLLGIITFIILFIMLVTYVYNQNFVSL